MTVRRGHRDNGTATTENADSAPVRRAVALGRVVRALRKHHFAVLSTVGEDRSPASAGVCYGMWVCGNEQALYVMTRRHLKKTRNIATNPRVSVVVPLRRRFLRFLPPATIQLHGMAEILDWSDACGTRVFGGFWMGRMILRGYERSRRRGEARICFLRITLDPVIRTYGLGHHVWQLRRHMESGTDTLSFDAGGDSTPPPHRPPESIGNPGHHTT